MDNNQDGKRMAASTGISKGVKVAVITAAAVLVLLVAAYAALCVWVSSGGKILPNTSAAGIELGGLTPDRAHKALADTLSLRYAGQDIIFTCGEREYSIPGSLITLAYADVVREAADHGSFPTGGFRYLSALIRPTVIDAPLYFSAVPEAISQANASISGPMVETVWTADDRAIVFTKGRSGRAIDVEVLQQQALEQFERGSFSAIEAPIVVESPAEPDLEALHRQIYVEAADAYLDPESKQIISAVSGVSFDIADTRARLAETAEGATCRIALTITPPALSTEAFTKMLFSDVLGETKSRCSGPSGRWYNIDLAAGFVNGTILLPGETFSYTAHCGPYSEAKGYRKAGAYVQGKTVDTTAGGICQLSSTLYWATLEANLETVERAQHRYNTGYLPIIGTDATVYGESPDFRFKNNTDYPIKLEAVLDKSHWLHVTIYGTNTTGLSGSPYSIKLADIPGEIIYEANADKVPLGGAPVKDRERTLYNGIKVEVHQRLIDKDGNLVRDFVLHTDKYSARNGVYFYHPADAARLGIDPTTGRRTPVAVTPAPSPTPTTQPGGTETPPAESPGITPPVPVPSEGPMPPPEAVTPAPTPAPTPSAEPPVTPIPTAAPAV